MRAGLMEAIRVMRSAEARYDDANMLAHAEDIERRAIELRKHAEDNGL